MTPRAVQADRQGVDVWLEEESQCDGKGALSPDPQPVFQLLGSVQLVSGLQGDPQTWQGLGR